MAEALDGGISAPTNRFQSGCSGSSHVHATSRPLPSIEMRLSGDKQRLCCELNKSHLNAIGPWDSMTLWLRHRDDWSACSV
jgi:hypothetical protein